MSLRYLSISQLSDVTGIDRRTISKRLAAVQPHSTVGRAIRYDAHAVLPELLSAGTAVDMDKALEEAKLGVVQAQQAKLEIEVGKLRGELIPIDHVAKAVEKEYAFVRAQLRSIPSKLAKPLSMVSDPNEVHTRLHEAVDECLAELVADATYADKNETLTVSEMFNEMPEQTSGDRSSEEQ